MSRLSRTIITFATGTTLLLTTVGVAEASDLDAPANQVAETIAEVAPDAGPVADTAEVQGTFSASDGITTVTVPAAPDAPVEITSNDDALPDVTITLPEFAGTNDARKADDGTLVYTSDDDASIAVQPLDDGSTRLLSILDNKNAPEHYSYTFEGFSLNLLDDGSVDIVDGDAIVGLIEAPWARDADGAPLPTYYTVNGSTLTQVVLHADADTHYPVTADPKVSIGIGYYWHFNRAETATFSSYGISGTGIVTGGCAAVGTALGTLAGGVGAPIGGVLGGAACAAVVGPFIFNAGVAQRSKPKACVYFRIVGPLYGSGVYKDSRCK